MVAEEKLYSLTEMAESLGLAEPTARRYRDAFEEFLPSVGVILARGAVRFTNAYCNNPVCTPSRASMLTGLYNHHFEAQRCHRDPCEVFPKDTAMPQVLGNADQGRRQRGSHATPGCRVRAQRRLPAYRRIGQTAQPAAGQQAWGDRSNPAAFPQVLQQHEPRAV